MLKNRITYGVVLIVLVLLIYLYEDSITYVAFYAVLALPVLSLALAVVSRRRFSVKERLTQGNIVKGEVVQYIFDVKNNSFLPYTSVRVRFKADSEAIMADFADQFFAIWPYKSHKVVFNVSAKYRGNYEIGVSNIILYDFLGLFRFRQKHSETFVLTVNPVVHDIPNLPLSTSGSGVESAKDLMAEEDYAIISDLRKYQPTDGYKKIHWKVSAKKNELVSKNYQHTKRNSTVLLLDNSFIKSNNWEEADALEDLMMEAYVSALSYCIKQQHTCSLYYMGDELTEGVTGGFEYLYAIASKICFGDEDDFDDYITNYSKMQIDSENLIMLVQDISDTVFAAVQSLRFFGNNVIVFYFKDLTENETAKISLLREINVKSIDFRNVFENGGGFKWQL